MKRQTPAVSDPQFRVFRNLGRGDTAEAGLYGMAAMGGLTRTLASMRRRGWLTPRDQLTAAGREVCRQLGIKVQP